MTRPIPTPKRTLSPRNLNVLYDIARFKFLTTEHVRTLHFRHVATSSEAPRMLLHRLRRQGLVERQLSFVRSTQSAEGLTVTKPRPVWMMPSPRIKTLQKSLARDGRRSEGDRFSNSPGSNHGRSFSEQALAHEIGISSLLLALEQAAKKKVGLETLKWLRSSPRHELTSLTVDFRLNGKRENGYINPDAVVFLRIAHNGQSYPFLFFLEYERGTTSPALYTKNKLYAYAALSALARQQHASYTKLLNRLNVGMGLDLERPDTLPFRVLTVARSGRETVDLLTSSAALNEPKLFNFSALECVTKNALDTAWVRHQEFTAVDDNDRSWQRWFCAESMANATRVQKLDALWDNLNRVSLP